MRAPVHRLKKADIVWLGGHSCKHGHSYLEHYECYLKENPNEGLRIGYLDIETTNLEETFGFVLCYCIKVHNEDKIYERLITRRELKTADLDKNMLKQLLKDLTNFDKIMTYYGSRFDFPYLRSRCVHLGLEFPEYGELFHKDMYYVVRGKFKFHSNRQDVACREILGDTEKTYLSGQEWRRAPTGHQPSLNYILDHCEHDVRDLNRLTNAIVNFHLPSNRSV